MEILVIGAHWEAQQWQYALENADEHWRCTCAASMDTLLLRSLNCDILLLCRTPGASCLLTQLYHTPPLHTPWLIGDSWSHPLLDTTCPLQQACTLPDRINHMVRSQQLPGLTRKQLPKMTALAAALLRTLNMQPRLGAWEFLPDMLALCTMQPALLSDVSRLLYPLCGIQHQLSAACVERRLRLAVESTWNRSDVDTLEAFFGQTIDPQRGKPTNKEFLAQLSQCLTNQASTSCR